MADPRSIHEFTTGEVEATTLLLGDFVDLDAQSGYTTYKASVSDIGEVILEDIEYTQDLQTVNKTIVGAINENKSVIGYSYDEYDATTAYSTGDLCIYNNVLYKAKQATTGNLPTNTTYWEQTSIADEIGRIDTTLSDKADNSTVNGIIGSLNGAKFEFVILNGNSDIFSKEYTTLCVAFVTRGRGGLYIGSNADIQTVATSGTTSDIAPYKVSGKNQIRLVNNSNYTSVVLFIYD